MKKIIALLVLCVLMCECAFADVPQDHWFRPYYEKAAQMNLYDKINNNDFDPDAEITYDAFTDIATNITGRMIAYNADYTNHPIPRGEVFKILVDRLNYSNKPISQDAQDVASSFADFDTIGQNYKDTVVIAYANGLLVGDENNCVNIYSSTTYGEVLTLFVRIAEKRR